MALTEPDGDPIIEALRGFAALMVMATHYAYLLTPHPGVWGFASTGVDLFFVLSGYVFAPYLMGKPLALKPHLIRRFFRLYPLYFFAVLIYVALRWPAPDAFDYLGLHLVFGHTLQNREIASFYNAAFWSLPAEVEYYLALPLLAWAAVRWRARFTPLPPWLGLLLVAVAMHVLLVALASPDEKGISARAIATIHLPGLWVEFMLGTAACAIRLRWPGRLAATARVVLGLAVLGLMVAAYIHFIAPVAGQVVTPPLWIGGNFGMGAALGYALVVSGLAGRLANGKFPAMVLACSPFFAVLGQLSYGVYLFHNAAPQVVGRVWPGLDGHLTLLLCVVLTLGFSWAAHHALEAPMRNLGRRLSRRQTS